MTVPGRTRRCRSGNAAHFFVIGFILFGLLLACITCAAAAGDDRPPSEQEEIAQSSMFLQPFVPFLPFSYAIVKVKTTAPVVTVTATPDPVPVKTVQTTAPVVTTLRTIATPTPTPTPAPEITLVTPTPTPVPSVGTLRPTPVPTTQPPLPAPTVAPQRVPTLSIVGTPVFSLAPTLEPGRAVTPVYCFAPMRNCGGTCKDVTSDPQNCGYCGQRCDAGQHCSGGTCVVDCPTGEANLYTDSNNCGGCGRVCAGGQVCYNGICRDNLPENYHDCGNGWVSFNDNYHCGACFHQCPGGTQCSNGQCMGSCGGAAVDLENDPNNCGACGNVCPMGICCNGACVPYDQMSSNCGACGNVCPAEKTCFVGYGQCVYKCTGSDGKTRWVWQLGTDSDCASCGDTCTSGTHCANGNCMQNCAEDAPLLCLDNTCVAESDQNCGWCGHSCGTGETCVNHQCVCREGYGICDGVCVEMGTRSHCGNNCQPCADGYECRRYLQYGTCVQDCPYGYLSCGDGSCKNVQIDPENCGSCGNVCGEGRFCVNGACTASCPTGREDCNSDGTCTPLLYDLHNCGSCGNQCPEDQACVDGVCQDTCNIPAMVGGACYNTEVHGLVCSNHLTDPLNCGGCGRQCSLHQTCVDGHCVESCPEGTTWCDNGGCVNPAYNQNNCGYCGNQCGALCIWGDCWPW